MLALVATIRTDSLGPGCSRRRIEGADSAMPERDSNSHHSFAERAPGRARPLHRLSQPTLSETEKTHAFRRWKSGSDRAEALLPASPGLAGNCGPAPSSRHAPRFTQQPEEVVQPVGVGGSAQRAGLASRRRWSRPGNSGYGAREWRWRGDGQRIDQQSPGPPCFPSIFVGSHSDSI